MSDKQLLRDCDEALLHWIRTYAPEFCARKHVEETANFLLDHGGTLHYVARLRQRIKAALIKEKP